MHLTTCYDVHYLKLHDIISIQFGVYAHANASSESSGKR
jgi:hypothetical protein